MVTNELRNVVSQTLTGCSVNEESKRNLLFKDGYVYSWSSALSVSAKLPEGCEHLTGVVNGKDLYTFLSRLVGADVEITCNSKKWIFTSDTMEAELAVREDKQLESNVFKQIEDDLKWRRLPSNFYDCLAICDMPGNTFSKAGVFIKGDLMISTDNKRVSRANLDREFDSSALISVFSVTEILRLGVRFTEYSVTERWIHFRTTEEGTELLTFSCNKLGDETSYPYDKFSALIDKAHDNLLVNGVFPSMENILHRAQCFDEVVQDRTSILNNVVAIRFEKQKLVVMSERGQNGSIGKYKEARAYPNGNILPIAEPVTVRLSAPFLSSALRHTKDFSLASLGDKFLLVLTGPFFDTVIQVIGG